MKCGPSSIRFSRRAGTDDSNYYMGEEAAAHLAGGGLRRGLGIGGPADPDRKCSLPGGSFSG